MTPISPVVPSRAAGVRLRPIGLRATTISGGLWAERRTVNRTVTIPHGAVQLEAAGNLANLRSAAVGAGTYSGGSDDSGLTFPFLDSDVYKWLEAVGWEIGVRPDSDLGAKADRVIEVVQAAQRADGYLNSYFQLATPGRTFHDMEWGHELYTIGHLIQAAIAWKRAVGDDRLLATAERAVERIRVELGRDSRELIDGHPQIEMALVELFRTTGEQRHLELAATLIERRGHGLLNPDRFDASYWQDAEPVRVAREPAGHAVRQLYLDCGAVDLAVETADDELLGAVVQRWEAMVGSRAYLTGGLGARPRDEAFGAPFELPPDVAYAETCAAIASVMLAWRLLLATGEARFADLIERTSLNGLLSGLALDGSHFFYANPLHVRRASGDESTGPTSTSRRPWYPCACCPPNLMRFLATFPDLVATVDGAGLQLHQLAASTVATGAAFGRVQVRVETDYPWSGAAELTVIDAPAEEWTLTVRVPSWCRAGSATVGEEVRPIAARDGTVSFTRAWRPGDHLRLEYEMPVRFTLPDARIDAVRGTAAIERGPLVYAVEDADLPEGATVETIELDPDVAPEPTDGDPQLPGVTMLEMHARILDPPPDAAWPYADAGVSEDRQSQRAVTARAVPYLAWGNRGPGAMRVWLPIHATRTQPYAGAGMLATERKKRS